jgi:hypothetical protein
MSGTWSSASLNAGRKSIAIYDYRYSVLPLVLANLLSYGRLVEDELHGLGEDKLGWIQRCSSLALER